MTRLGAGVLALALFALAWAAHEGAFENPSFQRGMQDGLIYSSGYSAGAAGHR